MEDWSGHELLHCNFFKCMQVIFLLQRTGQGKNLFTQIICMYVSDIFITNTYKGRARTSLLWIFCMDVNDISAAENWAKEKFFALNLLYVCKWHFYANAKQSAL